MEKSYLYRLCLCILFPLLMQNEACHAQTYEDEKALTDFLFAPTRYSKFIRPVSNKSQTLQVNISQQILFLRSVDVTENEICVMSYILLSWNDDLLRWNSSEFGEISVLDLPNGVYWKPLSEKFDTCGDFGLEAANVTNDGKVRLILANYLVTSCTIDMTLFPFDEHLCVFNFLNWNYNSTEIIFKTDDTIPLLSKGFFRHQGWEVYGKGKRSFIYSIHSIPFSLVSFTFRIARRSRFVIINTIVPVIVLAFMNVFLPLIPPDSGERLSFAITGCLAMVFISMAVVGSMPRNSVTITLSSWNFLVLNIFYAVGIIWSILIIRLCNTSTGDRKVPGILVRLFGRKVKTNKVTSNQHHKREHGTIGVLAKEEYLCSENDQVIDDTDVNWNDVANYLDRMYFLVSLLSYVGLMVFNYTQVKDRIE